MRITLGGAIYHGLLQPGSRNWTVMGTKEAVMMLAYRLVRLIETHSDALAAGLLKKVQNSPLLTQYQKVPPEELRSEEHTSELQSQFHLVCRLLLEKKHTIPHALILTQRRPPRPTLFPYTTLFRSAETGL